MTLRHMKIYLAVYHMENMTKAAARLNMTQPAVTRAIREMEDYYGVRLFERINRRLHITEAGRMFYSYALHIIDSFDQMEKELRNWDELGILRVGSSVTLGNYLLPKVLKAFRAEHPTLQIKATISNGADLQQALLDSRLDLAVIEGSITNEDLQKEVIASDRLVLVLPPEDPRQYAAALQLKDLARDNFLLREEGSMGRSLIDYTFALRGIPVKPMIESISTQAILRAVHEGLGISLLPEQLVLPAIRSGYVATRVIDDEAFLRRNYIVWHRHKFLTASARELMVCFRSLSYTHTSV